MKSSKSKLFLIFSSFWIVLMTINACQSEDDIKFQKYMSIGKQLYTERCQHCHGKEGKGLGALYPPLDSADYLIEDKARAACIVKNGWHGSIIVNNVEYNQAMPNNPDLYDQEIAQLLTYICNAWSNKEGIIEQEFVEKALLDCPQP